MGRDAVKTSRWFAASAVALLAPPLAAASTGGFSPQRLSDIDKAISSDAFEGRGPATRAEPKVINYIAEQFQAAGVQPGGDLVSGHRSWFQSVTLLRSEITAAPSVSLNENGTVVRLRHGDDMAVLAPLNGAKQVDINNAPLVFVGYG